MMESFWQVSKHAELLSFTFAQEAVVVVVVVSDGADGGADVVADVVVVVTRGGEAVVAQMVAVFSVRRRLLGELKSPSADMSVSTCLVHYLSVRLLCRLSQKALTTVET